MTATLFVIATPIGNLEDISRRALRILQEVEFIACEDTRVANKLLTALNIPSKPLLQLHKHNEFAVCERILQKIAGGADCALISDAGTPLISDPGAMITKMAQERGIKISPIPGASALIAALSASGFAADKFFFAGFLPHKKNEKILYLQQFQNYPHTAVFYESPHRILETMEIFRELFPPERKICIAREISKLYEEIIQMPLSETQNWLQENENRARGEFVLILEKSDEKNEDEAKFLEFAKELQEAGLTNKTISQMLAKYCGVNKKNIYRYLCE
ncbi:MAG: 16S rRNA (cytidine(1402)-2'-O)-methyltransferase [Cardiobacteriaceae bacterium]|nr:16S rRNA (cytidine(1402)-2'-O)-methyltransferase [Cardiobacteriaceae bacterium]